MKITKHLLLGTALALALGTSTVQAQFGGLGKKQIGGLGSNGKGGGDNLDLPAQQTKVLEQYSAAGELFAKAISLSMEALGAKEAADKYVAQFKDISGQPVTTQSLKETSKLSDSTLKQLDELIAKSGELSKEQKEKVKQSLVPFTEGLAIDAALVAMSVKVSSQAQKEIKTNPLAAAKFAPALYVASVLPGDLKAISKTLGTYTKLAKRNGIEVGDVEKAITGPQ